MFLQRTSYMILLKSVSFDKEYSVLQASLLWIQFTDFFFYLEKSSTISGNR